MMSDDNYEDNSQEWRKIPMNDIDAQMMTVNPEWGMDIAPELRSALKVIGEDLEDRTDGKIQLQSKQLWGLLTYYTRDVRLGNLDKEKEIIANDWLNFSGDALRLGMVRSFLTSLSRVITMLELSQSRGGFLRKRLGTFTQEHYNEFSEKNQKKGLFGNKGGKV